MRFRQNSNPYDKFTPEQLVMGDKAEELGFVWDRTRYPTPTWTIPAFTQVFSRDYPHDSSPKFGIPKLIWNREFALWAIDCAERVLPIWRRYVASSGIETDPSVNALEIARDHIMGDVPYSLISKKVSEIWDLYYYLRNVQIERYNRSALYVIYEACHSSREVFNLEFNGSYLAANVAALYASGVLSTCSGEGYSADAMEKEKNWQLVALAHRIDSIAPWRLGP